MGNKCFDKTNPRLPSTERQPSPPLTLWYTSGGGGTYLTFHDVWDDKISLAAHLHRTAFSLANNNNPHLYMSFIINKALHRDKNYLIAERRFGGSLKLRDVIMNIRLRMSLCPLDLYIHGVFRVTVFGIHLFFQSCSRGRVVFLTYLKKTKTICEWTPISFFNSK